MSNIEQVFDALHDTILKQLGLAGWASATSVIAFEPGMPIPDETFRLGDEARTLSERLASDFISAHANTLPEVVDSQFVRRMATVEAHYGLLLSSAMSADPAAVEMLGNVRRAAAADFDVEIQALQPGMGRYRPVTATPSNWYDPSAIGNWSMISVGGADTPPPGPRPGRRPKFSANLTSWQAVPATELLSKPLDIKLFDVEEEPPAIPLHIPRQELLLQALSAKPAAIDKRWLQKVEVMERAGPSFARKAIKPSHKLDAQALRRAPIRTETMDISGGVEHRAVKSKLFNYQRLAMLPGLVQANATPKPVTTNSLSISFRLCLVHIERHWLSHVLLSLSGWYLPTYARGALSDGASLHAPMALIPTDCIFIRDLSIKANWTDSDRAVLENSASLGPLSLLGREFDAGSATISVGGMQSIGWLCERMPVLPPQSDPNLPTV